MKCFLLDKLEDIIFGLYVIIDYLKDIKVNEFNKNDWYFVVRVLDIFFFWFLLIVFVILIILFYFLIL